jgi:hypothetical protein
MSDEDLRQAYQARNPDPARGSAPTPEEIRRLVAGEGTEAERLRTLDQVFAHPETVNEFELLRAMAQAGQTAKAGPRWRGAAPLALAASVLLVVAGVVTLRNRESEPTRTVGTEGAPVQVRPDLDARVEGAISFLWRSVPGAQGYRLELLTEAGTVVTTVETADTTASYAATTGSGSQTYRWVVVALLPEGVELASPPRRLILITP